ncbi:MAG: hypothetical protein Q4D11_00235 [Rhodospirillales bacterium]|nr:hypothetical protein [Rhodospirillales bacterium]
MKKVIAIIVLVISVFIFSQRAVSQIQIGPTHKLVGDRLLVTPFYDYYPISSEKLCGLGSVFDDILLQMSAIVSIKPQLYCNYDYETTIRKGAKGASDLALGIYSDTSLYEQWKIIYPAALDNPVHLVMIPERIPEVKTIDDLKKLKGAIHANDHFNDFVTEQLQNFDLEKIENSEELYRKLITGEIDYIFITYWYGKAEALKLGINDMVSFSKKSIWNMPLFIGVSKLSVGRDFLSHTLTEWMKDDEIREKIKQRAIQLLQQTAEENRGKVPLTYQPNKSDM